MSSTGLDLTLIKSKAQYGKLVKSDIPERVGIISKAFVTT